MLLIYLNKKMIQTKNFIFQEIEQIIATLNVDSIPEERKLILLELTEFILKKIDSKEEVCLNFICTHNSRRSHLSQIWAQTIATSLGLKNVTCYSGGTEATAMFPVVAKTLENQGFKINTLSSGNNPVYSIKYSQNRHPIIGFSKTFDDAFNPNSGFAAIMTCSSADKGCPFIAGAEKRIPLTFEDPKAFDNTPQQAEKYEERSIQIATELLFVFQQVNNNKSY